MRDDDLPDLTYDEKRRLTDLELIRRADRDGEAFEILASGRIKHVYLEIKEWCDSDAEADAAYREISDATIHTAVEYSRHLKPGQVGFEPPDWFGQVALIALYTWIERNGRVSPPPASPPAVRPSPEERLRRLEEGRLARKHFDRLAIPGHREILEYVMIGGKSPEEAGRAMGMGTRSDVVAPIFFRAALQELLVRIKAAESPEDRDVILSDRSRRCLDRMQNPKYREFLVQLFNHSANSVEEAGAEMGLDLPPQEIAGFLEEAMQELRKLMIEDWRRSWSRPTGEEG